MLELSYRFQTLLDCFLVPSRKRSNSLIIRQRQSTLIMPILSMINAVQQSVENEEFIKKKTTINLKVKGISITIITTMVKKAGHI